MTKALMPYRSLGKCGLRVSAVSLGGWTTFGGSIQDKALVQKIHRLAYESGINFYDNADIYAKGESEKIVGAALKEFPRNELIISSKVFWPMSEDINNRGLSRKHIFESVHASLKRMQLDYFDLYFCHRFDPETPLAETLEAMNDLIRQGKVLYWGTSEWTGQQLREAYQICRSRGWTPPQVEQPQFHLMESHKVEQDVAPAAQELGMGLVTWSPLASGFLTGKYDSAVTEGRLSQIDWLRETIVTPENITKSKKFGELAQQWGHSRAELAIAWCLQNPAVTSVILGASRAEQLEQNLKALRVQWKPEFTAALAKVFA